MTIWAIRLAKAGLSRQTAICADHEISWVEFDILDKAEDGTVDWCSLGLHDVEDESVGLRSALMQ